jgi:hypothetical protein
MGDAEASPFLFTDTGVGMVSDEALYQASTRVEAASLALKAVQAGWMSDATADGRWVECTCHVLETAMAYLRGAELP